MDTVTIRHAVDGDAPALQRLGKRWADEATTYGIIECPEDHFRNALGPCCFVAESGDALIGYVLASLQTSRDWCIFPDGLSYVEIDELYVDPLHRDQGIGGQLLERCFDAARARGARAASVYSATKDIHAVMRFYEAHGFNSWFIRMFRELEPQP